MAGLSGKSAWFGLARQTAKGAAVAVPTYKLPFAGGSINPVRETDRLSETDVSRDQGAAYVTTSGVEGSPEVYVRAPSFGLLMYGVMGAVTSTPGTPVEHEITLAEALPWFTAWRNVGGSAGLFEKFTDVQIGSASISAEAGAPLTVSLGIQGLKAERLTADPAGAVPLASEQVFNYNNAAVQLGGTATRLVRSFELTVENNLERQQTDDVTPYDISAGTREISLGFDILFESLDEYNKFHFGGAAGTQVSPNIFTTEAQFTFVLGNGDEVVFDLPSIAYEEFPIEPDPGGAPIVVSARAVAQKATGVDDLLAVTVKNDVASYTV